MPIALIDPSRVILTIVTGMLEAGGHSVVAFTGNGGLAPGRIGESPFDWLVQNYDPHGHSGAAQRSPQ